MVEGRVTVTNSLGLHARAAAQLVRAASEFKSRIGLIRVDGMGTADAKSILSVLALSASRGTELVVRAEGDDEESALSDVMGLFESGFGE